MNLFHLQKNINFFAFCNHFKAIIFLTIICVISLFSNFSFANEDNSNSNQNSTQIITSALHPKQMKWSFDGFFGVVDKQSAQRGYQIYKEVCSACHSLNLASYRNLSQIGFTENEIKNLLLPIPMKMLPALLMEALFPLIYLLLLKHDMMVQIMSIPCLQAMKMPQKILF